MTYGYKEFPQDVLDAFSTLIEKYNLSTKVKEDYFVELSNENVVISFLFDRGDLYSNIQKGRDDFSFAIWQVYNFLFPNAVENEIGKSKDYPKHDLLYYAALLSNELNPVILGDFHWYNTLKNEIEYENKLIGLVLGPEIDFNHPISQKFWKRDKTWRTDIERYIKKNNIILN